MRILAAAESRGVNDRRAETRRGSALREAVHLFVLSSFAIAQPVYDRIGERPAYLADMGVGAGAILLLAAIFSLGLPAILSAIVWGVARIWPRARNSIHAVVVYLLMIVTAAPLINRAAFLPVWLSIGLAVAAGAFATAAYFKFPRIRTVVTVAAPVIVAFPAMFLLTSPVARHYFFPRQKIEAAKWNPIPVVVVVLDELCGMTLVNDRREIDAERFPRFAELARGSTWFRNATTVYPDTWQALPAILSGRYPSTATIPMVADRPQNLFSILNATGAYELTAFEPISRLASLPVEIGSSQDAGTWTQLFSIMPALGRVMLFHVTPVELWSKLPEIPRLWFGFHETANIDRLQRRGVFRYAKGDDRLEQFDHFLECLDDSPQPQLYFMHVLLPHIPWCYLPSGRKCLPDSAEWELLDDNLVADELFVEQCQQRHLLQLAFTDTQIGRLLARLRETGIYDKCLLIVTADHGVSFKVGDSRRAVTDANLPDILSIPLFVKAPGQQSGAISDRNVETIDILPTITELLGIELLLPVDGISVFNTTLPERIDKSLQAQLSLMSPPPKVAASILKRSTVPQELRRRFGSPTDPDALFRIGPHPELIGRLVADLRRSDDSPTELALTRGGSVYSNDPSALVPCYIEGRIVARAELQEPVALAVAVNGVIRASTRTYRFDRFRNRFTAMVPESAYHEGQNDVQFYVVTGSAPNVRLTQCAVHPESAK
jgi:hypothetical protein